MSVYHQITKLTPLWHFPVTANIVFCWKQSRLTWLFCGLTQMPDWPQLLKFPHILTLLWFSSRYTSKCRPKEVVWCEEANSALSSADNLCWIKPHFFATVVSVWLLGYLAIWTFGYVDRGSQQEKAFLLPNQCIGFLGPPPMWHNTMEPSIKATARESYSVHVLM